MALVGAAPATMLALAIAGMLISGAMNALVNGPFFAIVQGVVDPEKQGRVFNLAGSLTAAAWPVSLALAGPIADVVGVRPWFVVGGVVCTITAIVAMFVPAITHLEDVEPGDGARSVELEVVPGAQE